MDRRNKKGKVTTKRINKKIYYAHMDTESPTRNGRVLTMKRNAAQTNHPLRAQKICTNRTIINTSLFVNNIDVWKNETCR